MVALKTAKPHQRDSRERPAHFIRCPVEMRHTGKTESDHGCLILLSQMPQETAAEIRCQSSSVSRLRHRVPKVPKPEDEGTDSDETGKAARVANKVTHEKTISAVPSKQAVARDPSESAGTRQPHVSGLRRQSQPSSPRVIPSVCDGGRR